jgi:hypothetical protein
MVFYCLIVSIFSAYIAGRALAPGAEYLSVFRFAGTTAFLAYAAALWQNSIWWKRAWGTTTTQSGGCFGPRASPVATSGKARGAFFSRAPYVKGLPAGSL